MVDPIILVQQILTDVGFSDWMSRATAYAVVLSGSIIVSAIAHFIATRVLLVGVHSLIQKTKFHWDDYLIKHKALRKLGHIAPALVIYFCAELIFPAEGVAVGILQRIAVAYMTFMLIFAVSAVINVCGDVYDDFEVSRERPIRTYLQVVKIVAWFCLLYTSDAADD